MLAIIDATQIISLIVTNTELCISHVSPLKYFKQLQYGLKVSSFILHMPLFKQVKFV
jgi:hypothetical protein